VIEKLLTSEEAKPSLDAFVRGLNKAGHPATVDLTLRSFSRRGECFLLTVDGHEVPIQVWQSSSSLRRHLCLYTGELLRREEHLISAKGRFDMERVLKSIDFHRKMMAQVRRRVAIETTLSELEAKFGLTRGQFTDVGFDGVTIDRRQQDDDAPERYLVRFRANIPLPLETAKAVLDLLANDGVLKSKP